MTDRYRKLVMVSPALILVPALLLTLSTENTMMLDAKTVAGTWTKITTDSCAASYPPAITLREDGLYVAPGGVEAGAIWHGGDWTIEGSDTLRIQIANDAMLPYRVDGIDETTLTLTDEGGCTVVYTRPDR